MAEEAEPSQAEGSVEEPGRGQPAWSGCRPKADPASGESEAANGRADARGV